MAEQDGCDGKIERIQVSSWIGHPLGPDTPYSYLYTYEDTTGILTDKRMDIRPVRSAYRSNTFVIISLLLTHSR